MKAASNGPRGSRKEFVCFLKWFSTSARAATSDKAGKRAVFESSDAIVATHLSLELYNCSMQDYYQEQMSVRARSTRSSSPTLYELRIREIVELGMRCTQHFPQLVRHQLLCRY